MTAPLAYLTSAGERARAIVPLTWFTLLVSLTVCIVIAILLWMAASRAHGNGGAGETRAIPVESGNNGLLWITTGLWISAVPLAITLVWTMVTLAAVSGPPTNPGLVLDVTGHQWWWEVTYVTQDPSQTFTTANEIHIPVGMRVLVRLHGGDVIHSFWVPQLSGKTDTIPGQTNLAWLQADQPGRYRGQCSEYCGAQHAHMGLEVVAESRSILPGLARASVAAGPRSAGSKPSARPCTGGVSLRALPSGARNPGRSPQRSGPDPLSQPQHHRRRRAAQ